MDEPSSIDDATYTPYQRATYLPPLCPVCCTELIPHWLAAGSAGPNRMFRLAYVFCRNGCEDR